MSLTLWTTDHFHYLDGYLRHLAAKLVCEPAPFKEALQRCTSLESLSLSGFTHKWSQEEQYQFFTFIGGLGTVVQLEINMNFESLASALPKWTSLTKLNLSWALNTPSFPRQLACLSQILALRLTTFEFKAEVLQDLDESFAQLTQLTSLNLDQTRFSTASDPVFVFRHCSQLRELHLPAVMVHSEHADLLKSALWPLTKLQTLQVGWFSPQGAAWEVFCTHLQRCPDLQSLDWSQYTHTTMTERYEELALVPKVGLVGLTDYLAVANLTQLNFSHTVVNLEEWTQFCHQILPQCTQLVELDLTNPNCSLFEFCEPLLESVMCLTSLERLWFVEFDMPPPQSCWEQLQKMVEATQLIDCGCRELNFFSVTTMFNGEFGDIQRRNVARRRTLLSYVKEAED